jgi:hypothetical protein
MTDSLRDASMQARRTNRTFWILVGLLSVLGAVSVFLPGPGLAGMPAAELPAPRGVVALATLAGLAVIYGGLGYLGLRATRAVGFPEFWADDVTARQRFGLPAVLGALLAILFIVTDLLLASHNGLGPIPHPPFPTSLVASATAAIGEEILFRLLVVAGGYWLLTRVVHSERGRAGAFWAVVLFSAVAFTSAHVPSFLYLVGDGDPTAASLSTTLVMELLLMNGTLSIAAALLLRRAGLLAAVGVHFWTDVVWHVAWGGLR